MTGFESAFNKFVQSMDMVLPDRTALPYREDLWYQVHAAQRIPERVGILAPRLGMISASILTCDQQKRWASCDHRGQLRFNWRIITAPTSLVHYVVAHELRHLVRHDHSPTFWKPPCTVLPDYAERRERLRREGWRFGSD